MSRTTSRILIINSEFEDRSAYCRWILSNSRLECQVSVASCGADGLRQIREFGPDCILLDERLSDSSGIEFLEQFRSQTTSRATPSVIFVAGLDREDLAIRAFELGADEYLNKPINPTRLCHAIGSALEKASLRAEVAFQKIELERLSLAVQVAQRNAESASAEFLKAQNRLEFLLTSTPAVIYASSIQPPYDPTFVSSFNTQQLGYLPSEFVTQPGFWAEQIHPQDVARVFDEKAKLLKCGRNFVEYRIRHKDGSYRWIHDELQAVADSSGNLRELVGYRVDITERKTAESLLQESQEKLRTSEERLRIALGAANAIAFEWDAASDQVVRYYSVEPALPANLTAPESIADVQARVHPDDLGRFTAGVESCLNGPGDYQNLYRVVRDDGSTRWLKERGILSRDERGDPARLTGVSIDVTELKYSEAMHLAVAGAEIGTWNLEVATGEVIWSDSCKKILGLPSDSRMTRERCLDLVHPDDRDWVANVVMSALNGKQEFEIECRSLLPDRIVHWLATKGRGDYDADGNLLTIEGATLDITKRKQAELEIASLNAELELRAAEVQEVNKDLESFAYSVSHDLRAPLRAIDGYSKIVLSDFASLLPEDGQQYLRDVRENTKQMGKLIDDLLLFSRLGRQAIQRRSIETTELVRNCLEELKPAREGRQVEIRIGDLPRCQADSSLLKQAWLNLLSNALKYSSNKSPAIIEIGGQTKPDRIEYYVKDNGVGFDMRYAHKLFGVFQRLHKSEDYEGTGVGLANVQRIIHRHGGRVWANAEPDRGATFFFELLQEGNPS